MANLRGPRKLQWMSYKGIHSKRASCNGQASMIARRCCTRKSAQRLQLFLAQFSVLQMCIYLEAVSLSAMGRKIDLQKKVQTPLKTKVMRVPGIHVSSNNSNIYNIPFWYVSFLPYIIYI